MTRGEGGTVGSAVPSAR